MGRGVPTCFFVGSRTDFVTSVRVSVASAGVLALEGLRPAGPRKPQGGISSPPPPPFATSLQRDAECWAFAHKFLSLLSAFAIHLITLFLKKVKALFCQSSFCQSSFLYSLKYLYQSCSHVGQVLGMILCPVIDSQLHCISVGVVKY